MNNNTFGALNGTSSSESEEGGGGSPYESAELMGTVPRTSPGSRNASSSSDEEAEDKDGGGGFASSSSDDEAEEEEGGGGFASSSSDEEAEDKEGGGGFASSSSDEEAEDKEGGGGHATPSRGNKQPGATFITRAKHPEEYKRNWKFTDLCRHCDALSKVRKHDFSWCENRGECPNYATHKTCHFAILYGNCNFRHPRSAYDYYYYDK